MQNAVHFRNGIPFYYNKTIEEFRQNPYERYDPMVIRQSMLHLADDIWQNYPLQPVKDFIEAYWPIDMPTDILEIGCGVGRLIGDIADQFAESNCWGIDFSYQMLKRAKEVWVDEKIIEVDGSNFGFETPVVVHKTGLRNLQFGLAKCELLPFEDDSQDLVISSFLLDRLSDPLEGLKEMKRIVKPGGVIVLFAPLNFKTRAHWDLFHPSTRLKTKLEAIGFKIQAWQDAIKVSEPLDARGNSIIWECLATVLHQ